MFEIIMLGIVLCLISISFWSKKGNRAFLTVYNTLAFIFYVSLGTILAIFAYLKLNGIIDLPMIVIININYIVASVISYLFSAIFLGSAIVSLDSKVEFKKTVQRKGYGLPFLIFLGIGSIVLSGVLYFAYQIQPEVATNFFAFVKSPSIIMLMVMLSGLVFVLIMAGPLNFELRIEKRVSPNTTIIINRRKSALLPIVIIVLLFLLTCIGYTFRADIYEGQQAEAGDAISGIYWSIMGDPLFITVTVLVLVGGLAKVVASGKASMLASNVLILWLPAFSWVLVLVGVIQPPASIGNLFLGIDFIAYLIYLMVYGTLMIGLSGAVSVFHSFQTIGE